MKAAGPSFFLVCKGRENGSESQSHGTTDALSATQKIAVRFSFKEA
jgi:hypothetical protein